MDKIVMIKSICALCNMVQELYDKEYGDGAYTKRFNEMDKITSEILKLSNNDKEVEDVKDKEYI